MARQCENWLRSLSGLVANTEAPAHYWLWSGIVTLNCTLERKCWVPYGLNTIYPNLYVVLVSPPGKCRKGGPIALTRRFLDKLELNVAVDSTSKECLVADIATGIKQFTLSMGDFVQQSPMAILSSEFSSILAIDIKGMIERLTDIYDSADIWQYKTKGGGLDKLFGPCVSLFAATTPNYLANNLPYDAFGAGFFSRVIFIYGDEKRQRIPRPTIPKSEAGTVQKLVADLHEINELHGPFDFSKEAGTLFDDWYMNLDSLYKEVPDEKFHGFIERAHLAVMKVAMALTVAQSNELVFTGDTMGQALVLVNDVFKSLAKTFGASGQSSTKDSTALIIGYLARVKKITRSQLLKAQWQNTNDVELEGVLRTLDQMKAIKIEYLVGDTDDALITYTPERMEPK